MHFITSDNPVGLLVPGEGLYPLIFSKKLLVPESVVYFPLSPEFAMYGTLNGSVPPDMNSRFAAELNTCLINYIDERIFFNKKGFTVLDNDGELASEKDVQIAMSEWISNSDG